MKMFVNDNSFDDSVHQGRLYCQLFSVKVLSSKRFDQAQQ